MNEPIKIVFNRLLLSVTPYDKDNRTIYKIEFPGEIVYDIYKNGSETKGDWRSLQSADQTVVQAIGSLIEEELSK